MDNQQAPPAVQDEWRKLEQWLNRQKFQRYLWLAPLVHACGEHPRIGLLFPCISLAELHLSRTTRHPHSGDCPYVDAIGNDLFRVYSQKFEMVTREYGQYRWRERSHEVLGEGGLQEAVALFAAALPREYGPAIEGDLDDLRRAAGLYVPAQSMRDLHMAIVKGDANQTLALISAGADVNAIEYGGYTALMTAVMFDRVEIVRLLLEIGSDIHACNEDNETALSIAIFNGRSAEAVELLRNTGAVE